MFAFNGNFHEISFYYTDATVVAVITITISDA